MVENFLRGGAAVTCWRDRRGRGSWWPTSAWSLAHPLGRARLLPDRAGHGQHRRGPAMTREQAIQAIETGAALAEKALDAGADLLATGEMGIGNTTAPARSRRCSPAAPPSVSPDGAPASTTRRWRARWPRCAGLSRSTGPTRGTGSTCSRRSAASRSAARRRDPRGRRTACPGVLDGFIAGAAALDRRRARAGRAARAVRRASLRRAGHTTVLDHLGLAPYSTSRCGSARAPAPRSSSIWPARPPVSGARWRPSRPPGSALRADVARVALASLALALLLATPAAAFTTRDMLGEITLAAPPAQHRVARNRASPRSCTRLKPRHARPASPIFATSRRRPGAAARRWMVAPSLEPWCAPPDLVNPTTEGTREDTFTQLARLGVPVYLVAVSRVPR